MEVHHLLSGKILRHPYFQVQNRPRCSYPSCCRKVCLICNNFRNGSLVALFIVPGSVLKSANYSNLLSFSEIIVTKFTGLFPCNYWEKISLFLFSLSENLLFTASRKWHTALPVVVCLSSGSCVNLPLK